MTASEKQKKWALIGALILPIFLIVIVWISQRIPTKLEPAPTYDVIYSLQARPYTTLNLIVKDNQLVLNYMVAKDYKLPKAELPKLYRYNVSTGHASEVPYKIIENIKAGLNTRSTAKIDAPQIKGFIPGPLAPDNYRYERRSHRNGWFNLFNSQYHVNHTIVKDRNVLIFSRDKNRVDFIGWMEQTHEQ